MQIEYLADNPHWITALARLHYDEWHHLRPGETLDARTARLRGNLGRRQIPTVLVAFDNKELLGSISLVATDLDTHPYLSPWLASIFVVAGRRRHGVGTALVARVIDEARSVNVSRLFLFTESAEPFFSRLGWTPFEHSVFHDANVTVMSYDVTACRMNRMR